jgi:hypothetical protein
LQYGVTAGNGLTGGTFNNAANATFAIDPAYSNTWTAVQNFNGGLTGTTGAFSGDVSMADLTAANGAFSGNATVAGTLGVTGDINAGANVVVSGDVVATGDLYGTNADLTGNLHVAGTSALDGNVTMSANANVTGNVTAAQFNGNLQYGVTAGTALSGGTFNNGANATFNVNTDGSTIGVNGGNNLYVVAGGITTNEIADATVFATLTGDAGTVNLTDGNHALSIIGGGIISTSINNMTNTLTINGTVATDGTTMLGDGTIGNKIRINTANPNTWTGTQTFSAAGSGLVATTNADFQGNIINSTGDVNVNDNLVVTGTTNLQGAVTANNGITVTAGGINVTGGATIQGGATISTGDFNMATGNIYAGDGTVNVTSNTQIGDAGSRKDLTVYGSTILGYQTAASTGALNGLANAAVVGYTGAGPINLTDLPAGTANGQILWLVNLTGGVLVVDGVNVANNEMLGFVYAAGAWHRMP